MLDFLKVATRTKKNGPLEVYPKFIIKKSEDLMIRGGDFYAIWVADRNFWSTDEGDAVTLIDNELKEYVSKSNLDTNKIKILWMWDSETGSIDSWHKYCQKQLRDNFHPLDENIIFSNEETTKKSYATKKLSYPLEAGSIEAYDRIMSTLYSDEERHKLEWAIGSIVTGDSKNIQKFIVLYGDPGTGKSTILNIIQKLFEGYYSVFDAKALGSNSNAFALEAFKTNPLVAIQHDGDLSRIEDNTKLNSLVSHEIMSVNEKFKSAYSNRFNSFLFMGTNKPVKISDSKSGIIRRLIDVRPTGKKLSLKEYRILTKQVNFELGAIASHCRDVYLEDPEFYETYIPNDMMSASNDFYNFVFDSYDVFRKEDKTSLKVAWEMYKVYCEDAKISYPFPKRIFKEELKSYFWNCDSSVDPEYTGFRLDKFNVHKEVENEPQKTSSWIDFKKQLSQFDILAKDYLAQYASSYETPTLEWKNVITTLKDLKTSKLHYVKVPANHIVIDFDIKDENGEKSLERNLKAASEWPKTYAELSKSGKGIHLHYIYTGNPDKLVRIFDENIEIKVFSGNSSLRRKLSMCNDIPISTISSGLPLKGERKVINWEGVKNEKVLRSMIKKNLNKEYHPATKPSIDYIYYLLDNAYNSGIKYDVTDLEDAVIAFAAGSTNKSSYCLDLCSKMKFKSDEPSDSKENDDKPIVFYDVEVFPNLFLVNYKIAGEGNPVIRMINPSPDAIKDLLKFRLVGFNCRRYDNHMLYGCLIGYSNKRLYELSQDIINNNNNKAFFSEAYNISYTDVYDFLSKKQSLKKWEIELGIHHQELGLPWDKPVPKEMWEKVAEYCDNDVLATEAVWNARQGDFAARKIQVELVKKLHGITNVSVNDTTNSLSTKIIFGNERNPQSEFNYRDLSQPVSEAHYEEYRKKFGEDYTFRIFDENGYPTFETYDGYSILPNGYSILPFFPGYKFENGKSTYLDEEIGEGGRVYSEPGIYYNVWDGDITSQHPHSMIFEVLFGPKYTKIFTELVEARKAIKHKDFETAGKLLNGVLQPYLTEEYADALAQALKIVINSIYGLTSASFKNAFRDNRNIDNIVAKRGALFMTMLKKVIQDYGFQVCHIKTDSIKIPNATPEVIDLICKFGKEFGYSFETEANFERFCLVNDAVYVAKFKDGKNVGKWTATGKQFAVPYVFKALFSHDQIKFDDVCETFAVSKGDIYLDINENLPDVTNLEKELEKVKKKEPDNKELISDLEEKIKEGHNYIFVGRVGQFCPVKSGANGGVMYRYYDGKYYATPGSTGYRWLESEFVRKTGREALIDKSFYNKLVDDAIDTISKYGDFEIFTEEMEVDPYDKSGPPWEEETTAFDVR